MKCPHCNSRLISGSPKAVAGVDVIIIYCGACQKVLGAVNAAN